jgi:hypothetical protein
MARTGSFGKRPKLLGANYTSQIAALLAQAQNAEWQAIQDAWQNGGTYDFGDGNGPVPVTDERILAYMTSRRDEIGNSEDPIYQQWNNGIQQMQFSIDEAKVGLKFKQGKMSAGQVASWYKSQLSKYPEDSAVYRTIAGKAADWAKSASGSASGAASASVTKALKKRIDADIATQKSWAAMEKTLNDAAVRKGLIQPGQSIVQVTDPEALHALLDVGVTDPITHDTYHWNDFQQGVTDTYKSFGDEADAYAQGGDQSSAAALKSSQNSFADTYVYPLNTMDVASQYHVARDQWAKDLDAANGDPAAIKAANDKYASALTKIQGNLQPDDSPSFEAGIKNELTILGGGTADGPSGLDALEGTPGGSTPTTDAAGTFKSMAQMTAEQQALDTGQAYYGQSTYGGPMGVYQVDQNWSIDPVTGQTKAPQYLAQTTSPSGGVEYTMGVPIYKSILVDSNGNAVDQNTLDAKGVQALLASGYQIVSTGEVTGYAYATTPGSTAATQWSVIQPDGSLLYTTTNPYSNLSGNSVIVGGTGNAVDKTLAPDPNAAPAAKVLPPGDTPASGYIYGSTTFDPNRGPEEDSITLAATASRWAGPQPTAPTPETPSEPPLSFLGPTINAPIGKAGQLIGTVASALTPQKKGELVSLISPGMTKAPTAPAVPTIKLPSVPTMAPQPGQGFTPPSQSPTISVPTLPPVMPPAPTPTQAGFQGGAPQPGQTFTPPPPEPKPRPKVGAGSSRGF